MAPGGGREGEEGPSVFPPVRRPPLSPHAPPVPERGGDAAGVKNSKKAFSLSPLSVERGPPSIKAGRTDEIGPPPFPPHSFFCACRQGKWVERVSQVCLSAPEGEPHHLRPFRWWKSGGVSAAAEFLTLQKINLRFPCYGVFLAPNVALRWRAGLCFIDVKHWWRNGLGAQSLVWVCGRLDLERGEEGCQNGVEIYCCALKEEGG